MKKLLIVAIFSLLSVGIAHARGGGGGGFSYDETRFWLADQDRNSYLDREEAKSGAAQGLDKVFDQVDKTGDGKVSELEFAAFINGRGSYTPKPSVNDEADKASPGNGK